MLYGSRRTLELVDKCCVDSISDHDVLNETNDKIAELRKEQQKFYDQRREFKKMISAEGRLEHLFERLIPAADRLNETIGEIYKDSRDCCHMEYGDDEAVLILSDWHYGLVTSNIFNEFNTDICIERVKKIVEEAKKRITLHMCKKLHIIVLGDMIHGAIHVSARVASEELVCDQLMQVSEILAQSIIELSKCVDETNVYMTYGNHARTVQNKSDNIHRDNMERLIPWWLEQRFSMFKNITVHKESDTEFIFVNVAGHDICATHGDLDSVSASPRLIPILAQRLGKRVEYIIHGDKHHTELKEELGIVARICGSLCGTDDFANGKRLYSSPSQLLFTVNPTYGPDAEYNLKC